MEQLKTAVILVPHTNYIHHWKELDETNPRVPITPYRQKMSYVGLEIERRLYADDIVCIAKSEDDLQLILDTLANWGRRWRVLINTDKSKSIHFRPKHLQCTQYSFKIGENDLEMAESYKYLGVLLHCISDFSDNAETLAKSAGRAFGKLVSRLKSRKDFGFKTFDKLYNACVVPITDYCASVWGYKTFKSLDNFQNRAMRYYLGVHRFAPILTMSGDIGWVPSTYRRWLNAIRFWNRLLTLPDHILTKRVFN